MNHAFTNELINESSPYLLKHAHNPVQWHAWNKAALARAKELDRPILASIGYSACHWCHVMEKESFENEKTASYMNEHFINIKIDREERPDLDHIYMDAVQAISGSGGWPLNVFLTPEGKPFYGGTYFPPEKAFNRASWKDILFFISDAWKQKRDEIEKQAEILLEHINSSTRFISKGESFALLEGENFFTREKCDVISEELLKSADSLFGGFGNAPKFPQTFSIQYLLHYGYHFNHDKSLQHARFSLNQLMHGGIYDHLAGGMARYSTDAQWMVPHFEKMLYDNALLVSVLCDAFQITSDVFYKKAIKKTLDFFVKEMKHPDGGFYAALDADSEGIEGKFYVWKKAEIDNILGAESAIFCEWYAVSEAGNWEHTNILHTPQSMQDFGIKHLTTASELEAVLVQAEAKLLTERNKRIRPITDDKILLGWNALLLTAFCKASAALDDIEYKNLAVSLYDFIRKTFTKNGENFFHTYKNNLARYSAYLDDYSYFIQSCIWLQEITGKNEYLEQAKKLTFYLVDNFFDDLSGFFYYTDKHQQDIITRKIELYDNAIPSGNSVMAENLFYLSVVFDKRDWWKMAKHMVNAISGVILQHPLSFGIWANIILKQTAGIDEIVITGVNSENVLKEVLEIYLPGRVLQISTIEKDYPLLRNKSFEQTPCIYWCRNYTCGPPMTSVTELKKQLKIIS